MALISVDLLHSAGMPSLALEALLVTRKILLASTTSARSVSTRRDSLLPTAEIALPNDLRLLGLTCDRLIASCWAPYATAAAASDPSPPSAAWRQAVEPRLRALSDAGVPLCVPAVMSALQRHVEGTAPADHQPLLPPLKLRRPNKSSMEPTSFSPLSPTGSVTHSVGSPSGQSGGLQFLSRGGQPGGSAYSVPSPRGSMDHSPRRSGSSFGHTSVGGGGAAQTRPVTPGGASGMSSSGSSQLHMPAGAVHPIAHSGGGGSSAPPLLFEDPLEVVSIEGDKCRGVASSGLVTPDGHGRPIAVVTGERKDRGIVHRDRTIYLDRIGCFPSGTLD